MKDFFGNQERARTKTAQLICLFVLSIAIIIVSVYLVATGIYFIATKTYLENKPSVALWDFTRFFLVFVGTLLVILGGTLYKIHELKAGGARIARMLGGRLIARNTTVPEEKKLFHVVEEIAIASGVPVPELYVMDREAAINAFAAGFGMEDAVISVTRGTLVLMDRDELQGVIAHEFSHILNSDTLINIQLMGWLHGILVISLIGEAMFRGLEHSRGRGTLYIAVVGVSLYVLGSIGLFFGNAIKGAISRQREYLADAAAVQFTRNPEGLAGALKKIGGLRTGSSLIHPRVSEASHMYFSAGTPGLWMATHPPLVQRIKRLDPHFMGVYPKVQPLVLVDPSPPKSDQVKKPVERIHPFITGAAAMAILETVGAPMKAHAETARGLIDELPRPIRDLTMDPLKARVLIYGMLMDPNEVVRDAQLTALKELEPVEVISETQQALKFRDAVLPRARLPLLDLAMPALRSLSKEQYDVFKKSVKTLVSIDNKLSYFEYILSKLVIRRLNASFGKVQRKTTQIYGLQGVARECSVLLSMLARIGNRLPEKTRGAFDEGEKILREKKVTLDLLPENECTIRALDLALEKMAVTSPPIKKKVLAACLKCMTFDGTMTPEEVELFRIVAQSLDVPVPPWASVAG
jgi:Zn-dependent protease with chaperone function